MDSRFKGSGFLTSQVTMSLGHGLLGMAKLHTQISTQMGDTMAQCMRAALRAMRIRNGDIKVNFPATMNSTSEETRTTSRSPVIGTEKSKGRARKAY